MFTIKMLTLTSFYFELKLFKYDAERLIRHGYDLLMCTKMNAASSGL